MKKFALVLAAAIALCASGSFAGTFAKQLTITVQTGAVTGVLENFPALVRLSESITGFSYSDFQQDGADMMFTDGDGHILPHEIDTWDTTGTSLVWVKVREYKVGAKIKMYYGGDAAASSATSVWSGYAGVWHMNEADYSFADSTGHGLAATPTGNDTTLITSTDSGKAGKAVCYGDEPGNSTYLEVPSYDSLALGGSFTISGWFKADAIQYSRIFSRGTAAAAGFEAELGNDGAVYARGSTEVGTFVSTSATPMLTDWTQVTLVYEDTSVSVYVDGSLAASGTTDAVVDNGNPLCIGCGGVAGSKWALKGSIDEVRLMDGTPSAAWIAAEYATVNNASTLAYGRANDAESTTGAAACSRRLAITVPAASVPDGESLTDFPVLVRLSADITDFDYGDFALANGGDLMFTDECGAVLPHEVDTWDESGTSLVWVKLPTLAAGTKIYAYWGNPFATANAAAASVWSDYGFVMHLGEESGTAYDSTSHDLNGSPSGTGKYNGNTAEQIMVGCDGVIGKGRINQTSNSYYMGNEGWGYYNRLSIPSYDSLGYGGTFTFSGWFKANGDTEWYERLVSRKAADGGPGWEVMFNTYKNMKSLKVMGGSTAGESFTTTSIVNGWKHLVFVYDGTSCSYYFDGELVGTATIDAATDNGAPLYVGGTEYNQLSFNGRYDELRLRGGAATAARVAADFATVKNADFLRYDVVENISVKNVPGQFSHFAEMTVATDRELSDYPALVRISEAAISGFRYSDAASGGSDILFTDEDGDVLASEIDTWKTGGESLIWVKIPEFRKGARFRMYWGWTGASEDWPGRDSTDVWNDYTVVLHMNEASGNAIDSTAHGLDAVPTGTDTSVMVGKTGKIGVGRYNQTYNKDIKNYYAVPNYDAYGLGGNFTLSGWFCGEEVAGWNRYVSRKSAYGEPGLEIENNNGETACKIDVFGNNGQSFSLDIPKVDYHWVNLAFVYAGNSVSCYTNGALAVVGHIDSPIADNGNILAIGNNASGTERSFYGRFDEFRLSPGSMSAERIAADYAAANGEAMFSFGAAGTPSADEPALMAPEINGTTATIKVKRGECIPCLRFTDSEGTSIDVNLSAENVSAGSSATGTISGLAADTVYSVRAVAKAGGAEYTTDGGAYYNGTVSVVKTSDAAEGGANGVFTVSIPSATPFDLTVGYTLSGSAAAGINYAGDASGTVTIPAGSSSATIEVVPLVDAATTDDTSLTVTLSSDASASVGANATMAIVNLEGAKVIEFKRRILFTVNDDALDGVTLQNFPVLVRLSPSAVSGFSYSDFETDDGSDMLFTDEGKNAVYSQIDTWNTDGESLVWVVVPELTNGTKIWMYYGNGVNPSGIVTDAPWSGYAGVWHMNEPNGTAYDSTANGLDATPVGNRIDTMVAVDDGAVGAARYNQNTSSYYDHVTNRFVVADYDRLQLEDSFTFSGWFKHIRNGEHQERLFSRYDSASDKGWQANLNLISVDGFYGITRRMSVRGYASNAATLDIPDMAGVWRHLAFVYSAKTVSVYADGLPLGTFDIRAVKDNGNPLVFGNDCDGKSDSFYGFFDELRLKAGAASREWIAAEYATATSAAFLSHGRVESAHPGFTIIVR